MFVDQMLITARDGLVTLGVDALLLEAARLLSADTDMVLVCDASGALAGVVTKTDVVRQVGRCQGASCTCPVGTVMTTDLTLCRGTDRLADVSQQMKARHFKNVPVVDEAGRPVGVLTARAILRVLLGDAQFDEAQLMDYVRGVGYR